jgi:hypothetical protein
MRPKDQLKIDELRPLQLDDCQDYEHELQLGDSSWLWVLDELSTLWREAQLEASRAYHHWCRARNRNAYATYRAAQDRADAAQSALSKRDPSTALRNGGD